MRENMRDETKRNERAIRLAVVAVFILFLAVGHGFGQMVIQEKKMLKTQTMKTPSLKISGDLTIEIIRCRQKSVLPGGQVGGLKIVAKSTFGLALRKIAADLILTRRRVYPAPAPYAVYSPNYADNVLLKGGRTHVSLAPGRRVPISFGNNNEIPADTPPGIYYLGVVIDAGNKVKETNERNNVAWCKIRVGKGERPNKLPDLVVPSVKFKRVKKDEDSQGKIYYIFNVIITVKNIGRAPAGPFKVMLERNVGPGGTYTKACITCLIPVRGLAPGASIVLPPRQFNNANGANSIFRATADFGNNVREANERNNMNAVTFRN